MSPRSLAAAVALAAVAVPLPRVPEPRSSTPLARDGPAYGTYAWPVHGRVLRGFEQPQGPFGPGHRGIDIQAFPGTPVRAPASGRVAFAGRIAGELFVSVDHPDGVRTSYSWLSEIAVRRGDTVARGQPLGASGSGHPGPPPAHLHFGARIGETYIDPMLLLEGGGVAGLIRLAPLKGEPAPAYRMGEPCPCPAVSSRAPSWLSASSPGAQPRPQPRPTGRWWAVAPRTKGSPTVPSPRTSAPGPPS